VASTATSGAAAARAGWYRVGMVDESEVSSWRLDNRAANPALPPPKLPRLAGAALLVCTTF
jgi:hypothetical protein